MSGLLHFFTGYRRLRVFSTQAGEVMNILRTRGYSCEDFEFCEEYAYFSCSATVSAKIISECEARGIAINIAHEGGIPFILKRYRHRYGIFIGAIICALLISVSGRIVWDVRIEGNQKLSEDEVISELEECGLSVGMFKKDLDIDAIEARTLVLSEEISWISVNLLGTVANVEIREVESPPDTSDNKQNFAAANLIASRGGIIEDFKNVRGEVVVKIGDAVAEGDLLVSGLYGDEGSSFRYTCAKGEVLARTVRDFYVDIPLKTESKSYSGKVKCKKSVIFFKKEVKFLINSGNLPPTYDTIDIVEFLRTPWGTELPVGIRTVRYYEYENRTEELSEAAAKERALYKLRLMTESDLPDAELISRTVSGELVGDVYKLKCRIECIENIAKVKEIEIAGLPPIKNAER